MPGGRPTEYNESYVDRVKLYLDTCHVIPEEGGKFKVNLPSIEGCSLYLGVSRDTMYDWEKKYEEFSYIIDTLRKTQADFLINHGLGGQFNPTITKVILTKHGYREGVDQTTNDKDLPTPIAHVQRNDSVQ